MPLQGAPSASPRSPRNFPRIAPTQKKIDKRPKSRYDVVCRCQDTCIPFLFIRKFYNVQFFLGLPRPLRGGNAGGKVALGDTNENEGLDLAGAHSEGQALRPSSKARSKPV